MKRQHSTSSRTVQPTFMSFRDGRRGIFDSSDVFAGIGYFGSLADGHRCLQTLDGGWFDFASKTYKEIEVNEQCEVLSAIGDIAVGDDNKASLHVHVVLGPSDGSTPRRPSPQRNGASDVGGRVDSDAGRRTRPNLGIG